MLVDLVVYLLHCVGLAVFVCVNLGVCWLVWHFMVFGVFVIVVVGLALYIWFGLVVHGVWCSCMFGGVGLAIC
jgi:hypothetical protein